MSDQSGLPSEQKRKQRSKLENLITCPKCDFVYDTRYLGESCRMIDGQGYHCQNCNTLLIDI